MEIKTIEGENLLSISSSGITFTSNPNPTTVRITNTGLPFINSSIKYISIPEIEKVIFQKTHTIVLWKDKTRTVVNCSEEDFDKEKGLAMAITKKYIARGKFKKLIENADIQDK